MKLRQDGSRVARLCGQRALDLIVTSDDRLRCIARYSAGRVGGAGLFLHNRHILSAAVKDASRRRRWPSAILGAPGNGPWIGGESRL
jgi:hypothetical protein